MSGWIGVDLDGTLAFYDSWRGIDHIGAPIPLMLQRVKDWVAQDTEVRIFTARVAIADHIEQARCISVIQDWLESHGLPRLRVTNIKDFGMIVLYDDRAIQVQENTGILVR